MSRPAIFTTESFSDARSRAEKQGKLLVVDAMAQWCPSCQTMDRSTWRHTDVVEWFAAHAIAVRVDVDQEARLGAELNIQAMPTVVVFRGERELNRAVGLLSSAELLSWLRGVL